MSWEQDINQLLQSLEESAVRFDIEQELTGTEESTAKTNIGFGGASVTLIEGQDYKINMS